MNEDVQVGAGWSRLEACAAAQRPGRGGDLGADVLSLSFPSSRSSAHSPSYYVLLLRLGIVQGWHYLIARVWLPCPLRHLGRSTVAVLAAESWLCKSHSVQDEVDEWAEERSTFWHLAP